MTEKAFQGSSDGTSEIIEFTAVGAAAPDIEELLNRLKPHQYQCDCAFCFNFFSVRQSVTAAFSLLQEKLQAIEDVAEQYVNTDDDDHANWVSIMGGMIIETRKCMDEARMEASRLRSELERLTKERDALRIEVGGLRFDNRCLEQDRLLMARLAADTPQFSNPLAAWEAQALRDGILKDSKLRLASPTPEQKNETP